MKKVKILGIIGLLLLSLLVLSSCSGGSYDQGYTEGQQKVINCINACNTGTGVVNECFDADCVNGCIEA